MTPMHVHIRTAHYHFLSCCAVLRWQHGSDSTPAIPHLVAPRRSAICIAAGIFFFIFIFLLWPHVDRGRHEERVCVCACACVTHTHTHSLSVLPLLWTGRCSCVHRLRRSAAAPPAAPGAKDVRHHQPVHLNREDTEVWWPVSTTHSHPLLIASAIGLVWVPRLLPMRSFPLPLCVHACLCAYLCVCVCMCVCVYVCTRRSCLRW